MRGVPPVPHFRDMVALGGQMIERRLCVLALLLFALASVDAFCPRPRVTSVQEPGRSWATLDLRPLNGGGASLTLFAPATPLIQQDLSPRAQSISRAGAASMMANDASEDDEGFGDWDCWEMEQVVDSASYLETVMAFEAKALQGIEEFLNQNPPSCPAAQAPDDILG